jgi:2-polyprenyl-6-methoxyphenol hydroxylase-like FAD-dependent oxidoreductase
VNNLKGWNYSMGSRVNGRALVIGGGIGGLSAALALRQARMDVQVFEAVEAVKEVGAGVTIWSNAVRALQKLGLTDALQAIGMPATYRIIYTWKGELLSKIQVDQLANGLGAAILMMHRADLQSALLQAFGAANVQLGARCVGFTQDDKGVRAQFANGQTVEGDLLVAADGIHSALRTQLFGPRCLLYTGYATWRGIASLEDENIPVGVSSETWGKGQRIGLIPLNNGRMYWFTGQNMPAGTYKDETAEQKKQRMRDMVRGWHAPIEAVIEATEASTIIRADVYELEQLPHWCQGRVTLLGDAAHAMSPNMGQGACQAIEDAVVLGSCLQEETDIPSALRLYESRRIKRVQRVATQSRRIGQLAQLENPLACSLRNALVKRWYTRLLSRELDWLLSYEA